VDDVDVADARDYAPPARASLPRPAASRLLLWAPRWQQRLARTAAAPALAQWLYHQVRDRRSPRVAAALRGRARRGALRAPRG